MLSMSLSPAKNYRKWGGIFLILFASVIWGFTYAAQRQGAELMPPLVFLAIRSWIGIASLLPICIVATLLNKHTSGITHDKTLTAHTTRNLFKGGLICGTLVFAGCLLQQWGLVYSTAGKAGFLTTLYSVIVPFLGIFLHRSVAPRHWIAVLLVIFGTYLLCAKESITSFNFGDLLLILCACAYSVYIMFVDYYSKITDCLRLCWMQFFVMAVLSTICSLLIGNQWDLGSIREGMLALLFCGIGATAIAYSCQIIGQKYISPVITTILLCTQSVFGVMGGYFFLHEVLTARELSGCGIILCAVLLAQISPASDSCKIKKKTP